MVNAKCLFLTGLSLACLPFLGFAQDALVSRVEIEQTKEIDVNSCVAVGKDGLILTVIDKDKQKEKRKETVSYWKYDKDLKEDKAVDITSSEYRINEYINTKDYLYRLGYDWDGEFSITQIDVKSLANKHVESTLGKKVDFDFSGAILADFYIAGRRKDVPFLFCKNVVTGKETTINLPVVSKGDCSLLCFLTDEDSQEAYLVIKDGNKKIGTFLTFYVFKDGKQISSCQIKSSDENKFLMTATVSKSGEGSYVITGTYGLSEARRKQRLSSGVFVYKIENGNIAFENFTNYLDIQNFNSYLSERKQQKIERKKEKKEKKGEELSYNYMMLPYQIQEFSDHYVLVGEAYYPTYRTEFTTVYVNGHAQTSTRQVFDGYFFSHYFLLAFNKKGETIWSNSSPMSVRKSFVAYRHLSVSKEQDDVSIVYPSYTQVVSKVFNANGVKSEMNVPYAVNGQRVSNLRELDTQYWFDKTFLSTGYEKVKDENGKRKVFFMNKIVIP